jgi:hypothetical protein
MDGILQEFVKSAAEPFPDTTFGDSFRCSVYLKDGTYLPCVMLRRYEPTIRLAMRRFKEEKKGKGIFGFGKDGYENIVKTFLTSGNRIAAYDVARVEASRFAMPLELIRKIEGETTMGWTGFVLEMRDGAMFAFGTSFGAEFFALPDGYSFGDVVSIHNHAYLTGHAEMKALAQGMHEPPADYDLSKVYRDRPYFICYYDT